jgi:hypothetical protein
MSVERNTLLGDYEISAILIPKAANENDSELAPSTSLLRNLFPESSS